MKGKFCSVGLQCSLQFQLISSAVGLQSSWRGEHNWIQPLHCPVFPLLHLPAKQASFCLGNKTSLQTQDGSKSVPDSLGLREGANLKAQISPDSVRVDSFPAAHDSSPRCGYGCGFRHRLGHPHPTSEVLVQVLTLFLLRYTLGTNQ